MTDQPQRIQRKRTKGWRMPDNTVYVGRPTKFGNPVRVFEDEDGSFSVINSKDKRQIYGVETYLLAMRYCLQEYLLYLENNKIDASSLRGKNLACWCSLDKPCHADILLRLANER